MQSLSLKTFIRAANKKVADGGADLVVQAISSGWDGSADAFVALLKKYKDLFDSDFEDQLPSLQSHLESRNSDNLMAMCEVVEQRLSFLKGDSSPFSDEDLKEDSSSELTLADEMNEESLSTDDNEEDPLLGDQESEDLLSNDTEGGDQDETEEEEDFSALLGQRAVDDMSDDEIDSITLNVEMEKESSSLAEDVVIEDRDGDENTGDADVDPEVGAELDLADELEEDASASDGDVESLLDSGEAADDSEADSLPFSQVDEESVHGSPETEELSGEEIVPGLSEDVAEPELEDEPTPSAEDAIEDLLSVSDSVDSEDVASSLDSEDEIEDLLSGSDPVVSGEVSSSVDPDDVIDDLLADSDIGDTSDLLGSDQDLNSTGLDTDLEMDQEALSAAQSSIDVDELLAPSESSFEDSSVVVDEPGEVLSEDELGLAEVSPESETEACEQDGLLESDEDDEELSEPESDALLETEEVSGVDSGAKLQEEHSSPYPIGLVDGEFEDDLDEQASLDQEESGASAENPVSANDADILEGLDEDHSVDVTGDEDVSQDMYTPTEAEADHDLKNSQDELEQLELQQPSQEHDLTLEDSSADELGDLLAEANSIDAEDDSGKDLDALLNETANLAVSDFAHFGDDSAVGDLTVMDSIYEDNNSGESDECTEADELDELLDEVVQSEAEASKLSLARDEGAEVTGEDEEFQQDLHESQNDATDMSMGTAGDDQILDIEEEMLSDLLSDVTGRQISEEDLNGVGEEPSVCLQELVEDAEGTLTESFAGEQDRILSQSFRLEKSGEVLYEGEDEKHLKSLVADLVLAPDTVDLVLVKVVKKEVVRVVTEEEPISVSIRKGL
jgi:hypothetical protein